MWHEADYHTLQEEVSFVPAVHLCFLYFSCSSGLTFEFTLLIIFFLPLGQHRVDACGLRQPPRLQLPGRENDAHETVTFCSGKPPKMLFKSMR